MAGPGSGGSHSPVTPADVSGATPTTNDDRHASHALYQIVVVEQQPAKPTSFLSTSLLAAGLANTTSYICCLIGNLSKARGLGQTGLWSAYLFAAAQVFDNAAYIADTVWRIAVAFIRDPRPRPKLRLVGDNVPTADLVIVSCGEPTDVVLDTVKAACQVDYPEQRLRVILADDSRDGRLRREVQHLRKSHPNLMYYARHKPLGRHHGYKSGNLNTTLKALPDGQSEFIMVLDADMIPEPQILRAMIPHALIDNKVGMVTTPQYFYNIPDNDPLYQCNVTGTHADDGVRDSVNAAWCPGSGFVIRRAAWEHIDGFPEFTITEDLITSWMLHGHGWKIVLVQEAMQYGLQPDCFLAHIKQRRRWWTGHIPDVKRLNFTLMDERLSRATFVQRIAMFHHSCRPYMGTVFRSLALLLTVMSLFLNGPVVATPAPKDLRVMVMFVVVQRLMAKYSDIKAIISGGMFWNLRRRTATNIWLGIHFARDTYLAAMPKKAGGKRLTFEVTGVDEAPEKGVHERDAEHSPPLRDRLTLLHEEERILYYPAFVVVVLCIVAHSIYSATSVSPVDGSIMFDEAFWIRVIAGVGFPGLSLIETIPFFLTPVIYAMFPPIMPPRRERMVYDDETDLWRADPECKGPKWTMASYWLEIPHSLAFIWLLWVVWVLYFSGAMAD